MWWVRKVLKYINIHSLPVLTPLNLFWTAPKSWTCTSIRVIEIKRKYETSYVLHIQVYINHASLNTFIPVETEILTGAETLTQFKLLQKLYDLDNRYQYPFLNLALYFIYLPKIYFKCGQTDGYPTRCNKKNLLEL